MPLSRSEQMSRIRSAHTAPERLLRSALWAAGVRYRLHARSLPGRPDLVFAKRRLVVFIDGCFWHGCPEHYTCPKSRTDFWIGKLKRNTQRDQRQTMILENAGWTVIRLWEHEILTGLPAMIARL